MISIEDMIAFSKGKKLKRIDPNAGAPRLVIVPTAQTSLPQGYQNTDTPEYRRDKGLEYCETHRRNLEKRPPYKFRPRPDTETLVMRARDDPEFRQICLNLYNQFVTNCEFKPDEKITKLGVWEKRDEIVRAIRKNQVTLIHGSTGCGKSSLVSGFMISKIAYYLKSNTKKPLDLT